MAINAGPAGARDIVNHLKGKSFSSLDAYSQGLPGAARIQYNGAKETNTSRGAIKGIDTVQELMKR